MSSRNLKLVGGFVALALTQASVAAAAPADPGLARMPAKDRAIYNGVEHNAKRPVIGPIELARGEEGRLEARFSVRYPDIVRPGVEARTRGTVRLVVSRRLEPSGIAAGTLQESERSRGLAPHRRHTSRYRIELSPPAQAALLKRKRSERRRLVKVEAELLVDVNRDGVTDHNRSAASTVRFSHAGQGARASSADNSIFLILINATGGPIYNVSMPVMCMYEGGEEGSNLRGFNYEPFGYLPSGASHGSLVAANASVFASPNFQSDPAGIKELIEDLRVGSDVVQEVTEDIPLLGTLEDILGLADGCDNNASFFMFTAAEAGRGPGPNASTTGGWVMSEDGNFDNFIEPIDSAVAAAGQQVGELGTAGVFPKWGYSPVYNEPGHEFNPTSQALYPAAFRWTTYTNSSTVCYTERGDMVWSKNALIGDHGLSWYLVNAGNGVWELQVVRSGFEEGWSGANPANRQQTGNTGTPPWLQQYPRSYCPGW
ncbi:MAG TPA: hypothetical protein VFX85_02990 [Solirubrobacterales bacterium]|nr:hypothetical protein [Solirubrobacterales bacterium]